MLKRVACAETMQFNIKDQGKAVFISFPKKLNWICAELCFASLISAGSVLLSFS